MTDKNHEQYLEQIETAVAETTMDILEKHSGDLRAMAKLVAEKQVEINRLKEYQSEDKKTIRNLRVKLNEAVEEIECRNSTWETKEKEYEGEIDLYKEELDVAHHEYDKLKKENEELNEQYTKAVQDINQRDWERTSLLKEIEKYKEYPQQGGWQKALDSIKGMKDVVIKENLQLGKEIEKLKDENRRADHDACSHLRQIAELKKEIELQKDYIDAIPDNVEEYKDELHAVMGENRMLKEEIEFLKNQLDVGGFMNFDKYKD